MLKTTVPAIVLLATIFIALADPQTMTTTSAASTGGEPLLHVFDRFATGTAEAVNDDPALNRREIGRRTERAAKTAMLEQLKDDVASLRLTDGRIVAEVLQPTEIDELITLHVRIDDTRYFTDGAVDVTGQLPRRAILGALGGDLLP